MSTNTYPPKRLLKASEVANRLHISRAFAYKLMRMGLIRTVKMLGSVRVEEEDVDRFIQEHKSK